MNHFDYAMRSERACAYIQHKMPHFKPQIAVILGSGLAELANEMKASLTIPYAHIPNFPQCQVEGHPGNMVLGYLNDQPAVCLQGRMHYYEGASDEDMLVLIYVLKLLGCSVLYITNAAGSLSEHLMPGHLVLVQDHINFQGRNPLSALNKSHFGTRFINMTQAYDSDLRAQIQQRAQNQHIELFDGVYIGVLGPSFETPAEIRFFRLIGADVVGMSTIPEVIAAHFFGLRIAALSVVTNCATPHVPSHALEHQAVLASAHKSVPEIVSLLT